MRAIDTYHSGFGITFQLKHHDSKGKEHQWRTEANRKKTQKLKVQESEFNEKQKQLITLGIDEEDAVKISHENKILKCIC